MLKETLIKKYFYISNYLVLSQMYLKEYKRVSELTIDDLKEYNPGHLGSSLGVNFILSNLNYFLNQEKLTSQLIIGTGHSGVSLLTNQWLNGTLSGYYDEYSQNIVGLNNLIKDFGIKIRSEINPQYPDTIYDGGELGYSLPVAYGYAINSDVDIVPCIIGDGEAETGTISASWYLNKLLDTKSRVLPILNLNGLKMGSGSYLSNLTDDELINYFSSLGYNVDIIDSYKYNNLEDLILRMQESLTNSVKIENPLIIFRAPKGFTIGNLPSYEIENTASSHKNPLINFNDKYEKLEAIKTLLSKYESEIFDKEGNLLSEFSDYFKNIPKKNNNCDIMVPEVDGHKYFINIEYAEQFLVDFLTQNKTLVFSPDEIYSNKMGKLNSFGCFELLNENVLQGLLQGYVQAGNPGLFIGYEGFMPILSSMIAQYYKFLLQKDRLPIKTSKPSLNYLLTSICWENTYSHQNPGFVDELLLKNDAYYNVMYPKDGNNLLKCLIESLSKKDSINIITVSKRGNKQYQTIDTANTRIDIMQDCDVPELVLCVTGDYMLGLAYKVADSLGIKVRIVYITNPKILDINSKDSLTEEEFDMYFGNLPVVYLFYGYPNIIKSMLYERNANFNVLGYNDQISAFGGIEQNLDANGLSISSIVDECMNCLENHKKKKRIKGV